MNPFFAARAIRKPTHRLVPELVRITDNRPSFVSQSPLKADHWPTYFCNPAPCPTPLDQVRYICDSIRARSILDPFMGRGTTGGAANMARKSFIGIQRD